MFSALIVSKSKYRVNRKPDQTCRRRRSRKEIVRSVIEVLTAFRRSFYCESVEYQGYIPEVL